MEQRAGDRLADDAMRIANQLAAAASALEEDGEDTAELRARRLPPDDRRRRSVAWARHRGHREPARRGGAGRSSGRRSRRDAAATRRWRWPGSASLSEAADAARVGLEAARQVDDRPLQARLCAVVGEVDWLGGDTASCIESLEEALSLVEDLPMDRAAAEAIASLAFVTALLGRPAEAIVLAERGLESWPATMAMADEEVRCLNARGAAVAPAGQHRGVQRLHASARPRPRGRPRATRVRWRTTTWPNCSSRESGPASSSEMNRTRPRPGRAARADAGRRLAASQSGAGVLRRRALGRGVGHRRPGVGQRGAVGSRPGRAPRVRCGRRGSICGEATSSRAGGLMDEFLPRARQHAVIQQVGPALIVAGMVADRVGHADGGAAYIEEYCELTGAHEAYRHMEIADVVRLLVVASPNRSRRRGLWQRRHSHTPQRMRRRARPKPRWPGRDGDAEADELFRQAATLWRAFGHPLEEHLALVVGAGRATGRRCRRRASHAPGHEPAPVGRIGCCADRSRHVHERLIETVVYPFATVSEPAVRSSAVVSGNAAATTRGPS